jgi:hypothetical protein
MVEYGIVKFFDEREGKRFGFMFVLDEGGEKTGEQLFFHYNNGEFIGTDGETPVFAGHTAKKDGQSVRLRFPQKDEKLVFKRGTNRKGDHAVPWGFAERWNQVIDGLQRRPMYRVVKTGSNYGQSYEEVTWEGQSILELSVVQPKRQDMRGRKPRTIDILSGGTADSGDMYWNYRFEKQMPDGSWVMCDDPRRFVCCVPEAVYRKYNQTGCRQERCFHNLRR